MKYMAAKVHECVKKCYALGKLWYPGEKVRIEGESPTKYLRPLKKQPVPESKFEESLPKKRKVKNPLS